MKLQLLFIFSFLSFGWLSAQDSIPPKEKGLLAADSSIVVTDSLMQDSTMVDSTIPKEPSQPFSISFLIDYGKPVVSLFSDEQKYEFGVNMLFFDHYSIIAEYGYGNLHPRNGLQNGDYYSEGNYFRIGGGYMNNLDAKSKLGFSVRYGQSEFTDIYYIYQNSNIQENTSILDGPRRSEGRWVELVITSESRIIFNKENPEAKINHLFALGFHARLRFLSSYDRHPIYDTYAIPGYGRTVNNPNPAVNLYLRFTPF